MEGEADTGVTFEEALKKHFGTADSDDIVASTLALVRLGRWF
jgi:hypothetical protein